MCTPTFCSSALAELVMKRVLTVSRFVVQWLLSITSATIVACALLAPILEYLRAPAAPATYRALSVICHQIPSRSLMILGSNAGVCFRCLALYCALALGTLFPLSWAMHRYAMTKNGRALVVRFASLMFLLCLFIDGFLPMMGWPPSTNPRRVVTGLLGGWGVVNLLRPSVEVQ